MKRFDSYDRYDGVFIGDVEPSVFYPGRKRNAKLKSFKSVHDTGARVERQRYKQQRRPKTC